MSREGHYILRLKGERGKGGQGGLGRSRLRCEGWVRREDALLIKVECWR